MYDLLIYKKYKNHFVPLPEIKFLRHGVIFGKKQINTKRDLTNKGNTLLRHQGTKELSCRRRHKPSKALRK